MLTPSIRRGLAAGLLAGLLAGLFALVVGHDPMAQATSIEDADHADHADDPASRDPGHDDGHAHGDEHAHGHDHTHDDHAHEDAHADDHEHLFSRTTQQAMLPVATMVVGLGLGGLFGLAHAGVRTRVRDRSAWHTHLALGGVAWAVLVLAPTLTYPANPPGVGDPGSVDERTRGYLLALAAALATAGALWQLARRLRRTRWSPPVRQTVVGAVAVLVASGLLLVLPSERPGEGFPAPLLWEFRLVALAYQTLLVVGVAVGSGLLWDRAERRERPSTSSARDAELV